MWLGLRGLIAGGVLMCGTAGLAQVGAPGTPQMISGRAFKLDDYPMYTQGKPFRLMDKRTVVRVMPDGSQTTSETVDRVFRDSEGRFRLESGLMKDGVLEVRMVTIFDPVALTSVSFGARGTTGRLTHVAPRQPATADDERRAAEQAARSAAYRREHPEAGHEESLGHRVIAGEDAQGRRISQLMRDVRGENEMTMVTESWKSEELQIPLLLIVDSPQSGRVTREVTELHREEPDPALFHAPEGMTMIEQLKH